MGFSKAFPVRSDKSVYPRWEDVELSEAEEKEAEALARSENAKIMKECLRDAREILKEENLKDFQTNMVQIAIALFEKRASHTAYWKEEKARQKFLAGQK